MSDNHIEPDMGVEIFVLEPSSSDGDGSRPDDAASTEPARSIVHESPTQLAHSYRTAAEVVVSRLLQPKLACPGRRGLKARSALQGTGC